MFGLLAVVLLLSIGVYVFLRGSLAQLDGSIQISKISSPDNSAAITTDTAPVASGLSDSVTITRDALGVPTIRGKNRFDVAYATGFVHAQERFFQMDLMRRIAAGELSELFGERALEQDKTHRLHRFRARAEASLARMNAEDKAFLARYVAGVNTGLNQLSSRPFEYALLNQTPRPWSAADSLLVVWAMYFDLQGKTLPREISRGWLREHSNAEQLAFLLPEASHWDAPMDVSDKAINAIDPVDKQIDQSLINSLGETLPIPLHAPEWWKSIEQDVKLSSIPQFKLGALDHLNDVGSNNWAIAGNRSVNKAAIVADDMHLGIRLPNTWYRAQFQFPDAQGAMQSLVGVTLPGAIPVIVVGSNTHVAWGFTNSYGDYLDLIELKNDPAKPNQYVISGQSEAAQVFPERILVKGAASVTLNVEETALGPVQRINGKAYALHWVAHQIEAINFNVRKMETARSTLQAMEYANSFGMPAQNIIIGDAEGNIGWTIAGPLPRHRQSSFEASFPLTNDAARSSWNSFLSSADYPKIYNPAQGQLWTANSRQLAGSGAQLLGDGGFDLGARSQQIRDNLTALRDNNGKTDVPAVYQIGLDDRALFIAQWRQRAINVLSPKALEGHPQRAEFLRLLNTNWTGHASVDSVAYRLSRDFLYTAYDIVFKAADQRLAKIDPDASIKMATSRWPVMLARLIDAEPTQNLAWLPAQYASWQELQLAVIDQVITNLTKNNRSLAQATWGERNTASIAHPMSAAIPFVACWLSAPKDRLAGDNNMPRVAGKNFGQSERMVVSPGHEAEGILSMPGGQSGHPLSAYFLAGHQAWVSGKAVPLLPGATEHTLQLIP